MRILTFIIALLACAMPAAASSADPEPEPVVIGQIHRLDSKIYSGERRLTVRLPAGYADPENAERRYPVVYLIDGGPEQDFPHIAGIAQSRDLNWTFEPFILVGVETVKRRYEITPPAEDRVQYEETLRSPIGGSTEFRRFLRDEVKPWVEARYRANGSDAVMGESLAGLFVVETLLKSPDLFDDYIAISPSMWWDRMALAKGAAEDLGALPDGEPKRLYLTMGDEGHLMQEGLDRLIAAIEQNTPVYLQWTYVDRRMREHHGSIFHPAALDAFRAFYLSAGRTGGANPALYADGKVPVLSAEAQASMEQPCTRETAVRATFAENAQVGADWIGMCLLMKPGDLPTRGNLQF